MPLHKTLVNLTALAVGTAGVLLVLYAWQLPPFRSAVEVTEDAYIRGQVTLIAPQVSGYVTAVPVQDYQHVKKGDLLVQVDERIYAAQVDRARANDDAAHAALAKWTQSRAAAAARVASAEAAQKAAETARDVAAREVDRQVPLTQRGFNAQSTLDTARNALATAEGDVGQAAAATEVARQDLATVEVDKASLQAAAEASAAALHLAQIDLDNTHIAAPQDGQLGEVGARLGAYVTAGTQLTALVPPVLWAVANYKETQLATMKVGMPVRFTVDALGGAALTGRIERFSPATGSEFAVLKPDNATGNFTKVAQRLPVRIAIDPGQPLAERLAPGMSIVVSVDTEQK